MLFKVKIHEKTGKKQEDINLRKSPGKIMSLGKDRKVIQVHIKYALYGERLKGNSCIYPGILLFKDLH